MIKRAMPQIENVWLIDTEKGFEHKTTENIIISVNNDGYVCLVKETLEKNIIQLLDFNFPEPIKETITIENLFKKYKIFICDNLKEVAELVENNGWKL